MSPSMRFLHLVAMLAICVVYSQNDSFYLELVLIIPCQNTSLLRPSRNVSLHHSDILAVQANLTLCADTSWDIDQYNVSALELWIVHSHVVLLAGASLRADFHDLVLSLSKLNFNS